MDKVIPGSYCDHGHATTHARYLPLGGDNGIWVCKRHYHEELQMRVDSKAWDISNPAYFPAWELLQVYNPSE